LRELESLQHYTPDLIVNLYPTCPFRKSNSIDSAIKKIIEDTEADSLRSVRLCTEHPYKMWKFNQPYLERFISYNSIESQTLSYQLLPEVYIQNASIYISKTSTIFEKNSTVGDKIIAFIMDEFESIDINNELDFILAEAIVKSGKFN
jgi:CMP-N-acetylneuraminic acid synthetase